MSFNLSPDQVVIRNQAQALFEQLEPQREAIRHQLLRNEKSPEAILQALASSGFLGALIPKEFGGSERGLLALTFAMEAMGAFGLGTALPILTNMSVIALVRHGSPKLKDAVLGKIAGGQLKGCMAATEEQSGTNMFRVATKARKEVDHYVLNGTKYYISGADVADYLFLLARTQSLESLKEAQLPKTIGLSLFMVPRETQGLTMKRIPTRGEAGLRQYEVHFDNVEIPAHHLVGPEDGGALVMFDAINVERTLMGATALGVTQHCIRVASEYAKTRSIFGKSPIGQYQAVQHPLADLQIRSDALQLMVYQTATLFDEAGDPRELSYRANSCKYLASNLAIDAVDTAIETLGGKGFHEDYDIIHHWEEARLLRTAPVSNRMILNTVAEQKLGLPRSY